VFAVLALACGIARGGVLANEPVVAELELVEGH
jgi:hypothetical protein